MKNTDLAIITSESDLTSNEIAAIENLMKREDFFIDLHKAVYLRGDNSIKKIAIDVVKTGGENKVVNGNEKAEMSVVAEKPRLKAIEKAKKNLVKRERVRKYQRKNIGINKDLRVYFESEKKKGTKEIKFYDLYAVVKAVHPGMNERLLGLYLYNKKQLPGIEYDSIKKVIKLQ